jgi:HD-GYP domain-containing protein (c-di-GMP phosphodiesterase class II)
MKLRQPRPEHVRLNHPLPWDVLDARGQLLLCKGYIITDERQRESLLERGLFVDEEVLTRYEQAQQQKQADFDPFWLWDSVHKRVGLTLREHAIETGFLKQLTQLSGEIDSLTERDADAGLFFMTRLESEAYPVAHSLQTAFIGGLIARRMGASAVERATVINASLTMNIAMIELQKELCKQRTPLTEGQRADIRSHPIRSWQRLETLGVTSEEWLRAVAEHHESPDGKGYPTGTNKLTTPAEVIHFADRYCAMIVGRVNRRAMPANKAARELFVAASKKGSSLGALVVKELGVYPPGNYVRLANGEVGVVMKRGELANTPIVCALEDRKGVKYPEPVKRETAKPEYAAVEAVMPDAVIVDLNPSRLFGYQKR